MTEPDSSPKRLTNIAGVIGLATAVIGLLGTGLAVWSSNKPPAGQVRALSATAPLEESLEDVPAVIDGYMSGPAYVDFKAANKLCYGMDEDQSCQAVAEMIQRGPRVIRVRETILTRIPDPAYDPLDMVVVDDFKTRDLKRPDGLARIDEVDYTVTREGICITPRVRTAGAARSLAFGVEDGVAMTPVSSAGLSALREKLRETWAGESIGERQCWRFRLEGKQLRQDYFIDGVLQADAVTMFYYLPNAVRPSLHLPE